MIDRKKGRYKKDKNSAEAIDKQKASRKANIEAGKPTTVNGWIRPGQKRGGRPRGH